MFGSFGSGLSAFLRTPKMSEKKSPAESPFSGFTSSMNNQVQLATAPSLSQASGPERVAPFSGSLTANSPMANLARLPPLPGLTDFIIPDREAARTNRPSVTQQPSSATSLNTTISPLQTASSEREPPRTGYFTADSAAPGAMTDSKMPDREPLRRVPVSGSSFRERMLEMLAAKRAELPSFLALDGQDASADTSHPSKSEAKISGESPKSNDNHITKLESQPSPKSAPESSSGTQDDSETRVQGKDSEQEPYPLKELELKPEPSPLIRVQKPPSKRSLRAAPQNLRKIKLLTPLLEEVEYVVTLPMTQRIRDQYISLVNSNQSDIDAFLNDESTSDEVLDKIRAMLDQVKNLTIHQDIDGEYRDFKGEMVAEEEVSWTEGSSSKFQFLRRFFESVRDKDVHIALVAQPGRLHDIIENYLQGICVRYNRPGNVTRSKPSASKGRLEVTLIASGLDGASSVTKRADLVIAFDSSFNAKDKQVDLLRHHIINVGGLSPIIHLIVYKSVEHIERSIPMSMKSIERLRKIVHYVVQTHLEVGLLELDDLGIAAYAEETTMLLEGCGLDRFNAFPSIRPIESLGWNSTSSQSEERPRAKRGRPPNTLRFKRGLEIDEGYSVSQKRPRPGSLTNGIDQDLYSPWVPTGHLEIQELISERDTLKFENTKLKTANLSLVDSLTESKKMLKEKIFRLEETEKNRQSLESELDRLRNEWEDKKAQREQAHLHINKELETQEMQTTQISKLTASCAQLEEELKTAHQALQSSSIPEIAELEGLKAEFRTLCSQKELADKKLSYQNNDYEYMRTQYQEASAAAAESGSTIRNLTEMLEEAQHKAQGEAARLAEINRENNSEQARAHIQQLKAELAHREKLLQKQAEEIKAGRKAAVGVTKRRSSAYSSKSPKNGSRANSPHHSGRPGGSNLRWETGLGMDSN